MNAVMQAPGSGNGVLEAIVLPFEQILDAPNVRIDIDKDKLEELKNSIFENPAGLLQPITVRPRGAQFEIVYGFRRRRAMLELHMQHPDDPRFKGVPAIVRSFDDDIVPLVQLVENIQRADLTPFEIAEALGVTIEGPDEGRFPKEVATANLERVAKQLGWAPRTVKKYLQLYHAPSWLRDFSKQVKIPKKKLDSEGNPVIDERTGKGVVEYQKHPALQFSFLMEAIAFHNDVADFDKKQAAKDGSHKPKAQRLTERLVYQCVEDGWSIPRLRKEIASLKASLNGEDPPKGEGVSPKKPPFIATDTRLVLDLAKRDALSDTDRAAIAVSAQALLTGLGFKTVVISP